MSLFRKIVPLLAIAALAGFGTGSPAAAAGVSIVVNGATVNFDQPPEERAGRVFVPLRGVFEKLGASVVYANGQINATGNGRNISLHIGSTSATVNGQPVGVDVAPYLVGARTLVPLRFVAQALGASVNYDNGTRVVTVKSGNGGTVAAAPPAAAATVDILDKSPGAGANIANNRPTISGRFSSAVDANSVRISLDGRTAEGNSFYNSSEVFSWVPPILPPSKHTVTVTGKSSAGVAFARSWSFFTGNSGGVGLTISRPAAGAKVGASFTVTGHTAASAHVHIVAASSANVVGGILRVQTGQQQYDVTADSNGNFTQEVSLPAVSGGDVVLIVTAASPSGANATPKRLVLHT
ncbi:MAG: copper amine oxidase N-terminal domain-containing protein [Candidatus Eremiobacteraeota bacterium]|nr:copper amine oxidase N-terminal domain-containing protein [Candidatus Eremiobacteraeota bacterium]